MLLLEGRIHIDFDLSFGRKVPAFLSTCVVFSHVIEVHVLLICLTIFLFSGQKIYGHSKNLLLVTQTQISDVLFAHPRHVAMGNTFTGNISLTF